MIFFFYSCIYYTKTSSTAIRGSSSSSTKNRCNSTTSEFLFNIFTNKNIFSTILIYLHISLQSKQKQTNTIENNFWRYKIIKNYFVISFYSQSQLKENTCHQQKWHLKQLQHLNYQSLNHQNHNHNYSNVSIHRLISIFQHEVYWTWLCLSLLASPVAPKAVQTPPPPPPVSINIIHLNAIYILPLKIWFVCHYYSQSQCHNNICHQQPKNRNQFHWHQNQFHNYQSQFHNYRSQHHHKFIT